MDPHYLETTPVRPPPPGRVSNFVNPESHSYKLVMLIVIMSALVVLFTGARIYVRLRVTNNFGVDDYLCIGATIITLSFNFVIMMQCDKPAGGPLGIHLWDVSLSKYIWRMKGSVVNASLGRTANILVKVTFFVSYLRIFGANSLARIMCWTGIVVAVVWWLVFIIYFLANGLPRPNETGGFIDPNYRARWKNELDRLVTGAAYFNVITDIYLLYIPLHQIPKLGLSYKRKWGISLIFLTGTLATGAALTNLIFRNDNDVMDYSDYTWASIYVYMSSICETGLGIVCLSMPVVLPLFVSRIMAFSHSLGSWVRVRRAQRYGAGGAGGGVTNPDPGDGNESAPPLPGLRYPPSCQPMPNRSGGGGVRKFLRNSIIRRSRAQDSALDGHNNTAAQSTFNDLTTAELSYHIQLKEMQSR